MEKITNIANSAKNGWNNMSNRKKITMMIIVLGVIVSISVFAYITKKVNYATLFSNLELEDAGTIAEDLKSKKIPYKLENGGRDILIDEKYVDSYRLELAMDGNMPKKSSGFEIFDDTGLMVTDEDRKIMYQRALTGELERSIMSLDEVNSAKVHLVMPEKTIFDSQAREGSASVLIDLNPSLNITENMIRGIGALVSGAVDNLPEENIEIIDSKGNLLSDILGEDKGLSSVGVVNQYQKMQEDFQEKMEANLMELLGSALGRDKVKVSVYADLDFDSEETTTITYSDPVVRSEHITGNAGGIYDSNIGDNNSNVIGVIGDDGEDGTIYDMTINNELSNETRTTIKAPGKVNKMTTSIIYDGNLSQTTSDQILSIVAAATGYDDDRGDFISIEDLEFDTSYEDRLREGLDETPKDEGVISKLGKYRNHILLGLLSIFSTIILIIGINAFIAKRNKEEDLEEFETFPVYQSVENLEDTADHGIEENIDVQISSNETKAKKYAEENPEVVADLIKAWLKD